MFKNKAQKKTFEAVGKYLKDAYGDKFHPLPDRASYAGVEGSAAIQVLVVPWGDDNATVSVLSCCVMDLDELAPDLLEFLLRENYKFRFGAFSIDGDGDITFEHTIAGSTLDKEELVASVKGVAFTADLYDDKIVQRWGGVTGLQKAMQHFSSA